MAGELVRMQNIVKAYGKVQALDDVTVTIGRQEIVGLVGDNGAGKSTLIKVLSGATGRRAAASILKINRSRSRVHKMRSGWASKPSTRLGPRAATSVARNLFLGREPVHRRVGLPILDKNAMRDEPSNCCDRWASSRR